MDSASTGHDAESAVVEVRGQEYDETIGCEPMLLFWYVEDGSTVVEGQDLCEIESAKAVFVIQANASGRVEIVANEGDAIASDHLLARIETAA